MDEGRHFTSTFLCFVLVGFFIVFIFFYQYYQWTERAMNLNENNYLNLEPANMAKIVHFLCHVSHLIEKLLVVMMLGNI